MSWFAPSRRTARRAAVLATIGFGVIAIFQAVLAAGAFVVLGRAGFWARASDTRLFRWGAWFFAGITAISAVVNFASQSRWENFIWGPIALILAVLCVTVARSTARDGQPTDEGTVGRLDS